MPSIPTVIEDGLTFEANAKKKAEHYSKYSEGELVIADDSGLEVDALHGAPGVRSARYAADEVHAPDEAPNSDDEANNARLLRELHGVPDEFRTARFVCVIAVARNGHTLATFHGKAEGIILHPPRGENGFGYDPLFFFPLINKTFAEITAAEKAQLQPSRRRFPPVSGLGRSSPRTTSSQGPVRHERICHVRFGILTDRCDQRHAQLDAPIGYSKEASSRANGLRCRISQNSRCSASFLDLRC